MAGMPSRFLSIHNIFIVYLIFRQVECGKNDPRLDHSIFAFPDSVYPEPLPLGGAAGISMGFYLDDVNNNTLPHAYHLTKDIKVNISWAISDASQLDDLSAQLPASIDLPPGFETLVEWLSDPEIVLLLPPTGKITNLADLEYCGFLYQYFFRMVWGDLSSISPRTASGLKSPAIIYGFQYAIGKEFARRYARELSWTRTPWRLQCPLLLSNVYGWGLGAAGGQTLGCSTRDVEGWNSYNTDDNIAMFSQGTGVDSQGVWWENASPNADLAQALGLAMLGVSNFVCSLATKCHIDLDCSKVGSRRALGMGIEGRLFPSRWGFLVLTSLMNINDQLANQYNGIQGASIRAIAETFHIDDFYAIPNQSFDLRNAIVGLGTALSILGGFVPAIAPVTGIGAAGLSGIGGFLGNTISESLDLGVVQETYASKVEDVYKQYVNALDNLTSTLFQGRKLEWGTDIKEMMRNGAWSNYHSLTRVSAIEQQLKIEIVSRSIDTLWKKPPSNKMWVLFVDLKDDRTSTVKCLGDQNGPQELKYCADGGVYYAYNYVEDGHLQGHLDHPWGTEKLKDIDIQANVSSPA